MKNGVIQFSDVEKRILKIREQNILLNADVAVLYGVQTKEVNQAVKNNPKKFPEGYILELSKTDLEILRSKKLTTKSQMTRILPKAFTEKGLYMLATILKGDRAINTTIAIIETFTQLREFSRTVDAMATEKDVEKQKHLLEKRLPKANHPWN